MAHSSPWRVGLALSITLPSLWLGLRYQAAASSATPAGLSLASHIAQGGRLTASDILRLSQDANQRVLVLFHNQHPELPNTARARASRQAVVAGDQAAVLGQLSQVHATRVHAYSVINAVAATVSSAEAAQLAANPAVAAVVPDRVIQAPLVTRVAPSGAPTAKSALPPCTFKASLEPEALQLTNTAFANPNTPQAQNLATGKGVVVAFLADGVDPNNPDFQRPDGTPVFVDYQDFSGDDPYAPTAGAEAFGDASSIAAQGNETYNVNDFLNAAHKQPVACPQIKVLGMAPGASLMGLKVFGQANISYTSNFVQAIEYAVGHGANVINESFGGNPYPDTGADPISLANDAAVTAGLTVVVSSGDAGTEPTIGSPASDPNVIAVGASTQFRLYAQTFFGGIQLGSTGGYLSNNISSLSSGGPSQNIKQTVNVVAPGDLGWALCSTDTATYADCNSDNGAPSPIQAFGGTSESAPLTAGEAALVIQAYRDTHGGTTPSPALIKQIILSTAKNLNVPTNEQGAGLIDSYRAVLAARSTHDANGSPTAQGDSLLVSPSTFTATANPATPQSFTVQVTNTGAGPQVVHASVQRLAAPFFQAAFAPTLNAATGPTFVDSFGSTRAYVEQDFTVPAHAQVLNAALSWDVVGQPTTSPVRVTLFDPQGRLAAYSLPQDSGAPFSNSGYGHVDVRNPLAGAWRAFIWTHAGASGYTGPVHLSISAANFESAGSVSPASQTLASDQSTSFTVTASTPAQPGDQSLGVYLHETSPTAGAAALDTTQTDSGAATSSVQPAASATGSSHTSVIPVVLRSLVPIGPSGSSFSGVLTGGNGRAGSPGQTLTYTFDLPAGLRDLDLGLAIAGPNYNLEGVLVTPDGLPIDVQSTATSLDSLGLPATFTNTLQFFRRDPQAGRWQLVLLINDNTSGAQTSLPFTATVALNGVRVAAAGLPASTAVTLPVGVPVAAQVTVTNTGNTTKDFFVDPRLTSTAPFFLGSTNVPLPGPAGSFPPTFLVPPESTQLSVVTGSYSPTVPISMDVTAANGAAPFGSTGSPDIEATSFLDPFMGDYAAVATSSAPEVVPGFWQAGPTEVGPYPASGAPASNASVGAAVITQLFDTAANPSTGDPYALFTGQPSASYAPLTLAPGAQGTIDVTITPAGTPGTTVKGVLYVDSLSIDAASGFVINGTGDELIAIPYAYTVGAAPTPTPTRTSTRTPTQTPTAAATKSKSAAANTPTATATATKTASRTATATGTASSTPTKTVSATPTPTNTATSTPSRTATPTLTPSATSTLSRTVTPTPTNTATRTASATATSTPTRQKAWPPGPWLAGFDAW
jgi:hypothetical protein